MSAEEYGRFYWGVKTDLSEDGEIYLYADRVRVADDGSLIFVQMKEGVPPLPVFVISAGHWSAVFAASMADGHAAAVEHWAELERIERP